MIEVRIVAREHSIPMYEMEHGKIYEIVAGTSYEGEIVFLFPDDSGRVLSLTRMQKDKYWGIKCDLAVKELPAGTEIKIKIT